VRSHYFLGQRYLLNVIYTNKRRQGAAIRNKTYLDLFRAGKTVAKNKGEKLWRRMVPQRAKGTNPPP